MCGRYSDGGAVDAAVVLRVGPEVVCLGRLKGDPATLVVGLRKREVAICSGDDDCLANAGGGSKPCSGGIAAFDAQIHKEVLGKFREDRVQYILANTVQRKSWDGRISPESKAWAQTISFPNDNRNAYLSLDGVNPGLMDSFLKGVRESIPKKKKHEKTAEKKERKPSYER